MERERTRIARDIHDDLGASLTRITLLSQSVGAEIEDTSQARADVDQIYQTARDLTRAMDEIVWAVNPKHDTALAVDCTVAGVKAAGATARILHHEDMNACNTFTDPDRIVPKTLAVKVGGSGLAVELPPLSVATVSVKL